MKKNYIAAGLVFVTAFALTMGITILAGISNGNKGKNIENVVNKDDVVLTVSSQADFMEECGTVEELCENSDAVIKGTVQSVEAKCDEVATIYSEYTVLVEESFNDEIKVGDTIVISDIGGIIEADEYFEVQKDPKINDVRKKVQESKKEKYIDYNFAGAWRPEVNGTYMWFIEINTYDGVTYYNPANNYQGIFKIENNIAERYEEDAVTEDEEIGEVKVSKITKEVKEEMKDKEVEEESSYDDEIQKNQIQNSEIQ